MITINKDIANKTIYIERKFNASKQKVWNGFTDKDILAHWWGPKPWHIETKKLEFKNEGTWLYAMVSPQGEAHWSMCIYHDINPENSLRWTSYFCDENGLPKDNPLTMDWLIEMKESNGTTLVNVTITFNDAAVMDEIVKMGFEMGFTMGLNQLEELLG